MAFFILSEENKKIKTYKPCLRFTQPWNVSRYFCHTLYMEAQLISPLINDKHTANRVNVLRAVIVKQQHQETKNSQ